ncbi:NUDIX domain-containing protein [Daejeonella lutea]|uniref:Predicted NTP pyrophosphohydrolase, NUDIX family n=1 Tax=Daejeonella lutea TaxID=572036 RepID=A0A1T5BHV8_9SPHI|nr:NUDIX domain-containing protein [Daejeonella lutea]SKB46902.1 Predicted NTP pyrophosphohydrolase, NUDIX family [Daejeonella lutea]
MKKRSAGILMYRCNNDLPEVLLAHPGGPYYRNKDRGVWSIPKGEFDDTEKPQDAAIREFKEELGTGIAGDLIELHPVVQKSGKQVLAWAVKGDLDPSTIQSNTFPLEWPPGSGKIQQFAEIDRVEWLSITAAKEKIIAGQVPLLDELSKLLENN